MKTDRTNEYLARHCFEIASQGSYSKLQLHVVLHRLKGILSSKKDLSAEFWEKRTLRNELSGDARSIAELVLRHGPEEAERIFSEQQQKKEKAEEPVNIAELEKGTDENIAYLQGIETSIRRMEYSQ